MSISIRPGARLLFRIDPLPRESPRGYLCRVAHEHGYCGPLSLVQIAALRTSGLERDDTAKQIAHVLRLETEEWLAMCYRHIKGRNRFDQRSFYGERVSADDLNYKRPRICPRCLKERPVWWAVWDLGLVTTCAVHHCLLVNRCPACERRLAWQRPAVHKCRCGFDLGTLIPETASRDLVAINAAIYRAAGFPCSEAAELDLANHRFPPEMLELKLGSLLRLILFVGSIKEKDRLRRKQRPFAATDLVAATEIDCAAVTVLRDWPRPLREALRRMVPRAADPATLNFNGIFGNFYRHLFRVLPRREFGFLHDSFERFVIEDWKGFIRGQHRYFSAAVRRNAEWVTANEAERLARTTGGRILDLVHQGQIDGKFLSVRHGWSRNEYWIRRKSLNRWIADSDAELARYMARPEAKGALGLTNCTIVEVAAAGAMRYVKGPEQNFPTGFFFFLREDVMRIKQVFEEHAVPAKKYTRPGEIIALRHAVKNYLGRESGLAAVIRAVVDGSLKPVGYTKRFRGITGYLFLSNELRKYRPVAHVKVPPEGFLNYREAAAVFGVKPPVIRALVARGSLSAHAGYRNGFSKLVPAKDVQLFADRYVAATVVAKRLNLSSWSFARYLKKSGTPLLAAPILDEGRGDALFLRRDIAARLQIPASAVRRRTSANGTHMR
jgi:hypothetical protein